MALDKKRKWEAALDPPQEEGSINNELMAEELSPLPKVQPLQEDNIDKTRMDEELPLPPPRHKLTDAQYERLKRRRKHKRDKTRAKKKAQKAGPGGVVAVRPDAPDSDDSSSLEKLTF
eukprot:TRINITY_DN56529_c0_g1_i1.p2 TRINITY_DN56529_c0_g1~~TRINITY_DN56529_c0_g1_i1.p2  ORF type:complete len:118 (+),score=43.51 TRINITY_DN56529_c0_g1_i1:83-436(+)